MSFRSRTYEELPALSVRKHVLRHHLRIVTIAWVVGVVWSVCCTTGDHIRSFGKFVGFNDFHFGLLGSMPFLATIGQLFAAVMIERTGFKKYQFLLFGTLHRSAWILAAAVPFFIPIPSEAAAWVLLAVVAFSYIMTSFADPAWFTWMGDLIPRRIRGRYFARRNKWASLTQISAAIIIGLLMDFVRNDATLAASLPYILGGVIAFGALCGVYDIQCFRKVREVMPASHHHVPGVTTPPQAPASPAKKGIFRDLADSLVVPFGDRVFRHYSLFCALLNFGVAAAAWFYWRQAREVLGFSSFATNFMFIVIGPLAGMLSYGAWGRLMDRVGRRALLWIGVITTLLGVVPWLFITAQTPLLSYIICIVCSALGGVGWAGIGLGQTGILLGFSESMGRSRCIAAANFISGLGGVFGGLFGGYVVLTLADMNLNPMGPFGWNNYHVAFIISFAVRASAMLFLIRMPDPHAVPMHIVLRMIRANALTGVTGLLTYPFRRLKPVSEHERRHDKPAAADEKSNDANS